MDNIREATEDEIKTAKIGAIRNLVGEEADNFNLDSMNAEDLDSLLAELDKASMKESVADINQLINRRFNEAINVYFLKLHGLKESEAIEICKEEL